MVVLTSLQKTKAESKAAATPSKTSKQTPQKEDVKKEAAKPATPKKPAVKFTKLARNTNATLPIDVTFQGDLTEAKQTKATYSHSLKLDSAAKFALVNTVSPDRLNHSANCISLTLLSTSFPTAKSSKATRSSSSSRLRPSSS